MSRFIKNLLRASLDLILAIILVTTLQVPVTTAGLSNPGVLLLAQKAEQEKAKAPNPETLPKKPEAPKSMKQPQPQPEQMHRKTRSMGPIIDEPASAGTKKIGGQPIRAQETPREE